MAKMTVKGLEEYQHKLDKLQTEGIHQAAERAVYVGAEVIANQMRNSIKALPAVTEQEAIRRWRAKEEAKLSIGQRGGLLDGMGVAPMQSGINTIDTHVGFDGYNAVKTKRWPKGQPNIMVARAMEYGTSFMAPTPFIRTVANGAKATTKKKMAQAFEKKIKEAGG